MVSRVKGGGPRRNGVLFPPLHFAHVEYNVHRSAYPTLANYRFLKRLELKRIISIGPEEAPLQDLAEMCSKEGIDLLHLEAEKVKEYEVTLSCGQIAQATSALIDPSWLPALITCLDGCVLTGVVIMCLRRLQGWSLESLIEEARGVQMASSAAPKGHLYSREVLKCLQDFPDEIVIGPQVPPWLWQGQRNHIPQYLRVRHDPPLEVECESPSNWRNKVEAMREDLEQQLTKSRASPFSTKNILSYSSRSPPAPDDNQDGHISRLLSALNLDLAAQVNRPSS